MNRISIPLFKKIGKMNKRSFCVHIKWRGKRTYVNHPVLLKVWNTRFFPCSSSNQSARWFTSKSMCCSTFPPTWYVSISAIGKVKVMAWKPLEVYHSAYLFKCFCFAPNHPNKTTTVLDFATEQAELPVISKEVGSGKCHLYITSEGGEESLGEGATCFDPLVNAADWYKLERTEEETKDVGKFPT